MAKKEQKAAVTAGEQGAKIPKYKIGDVLASDRQDVKQPVLIYKEEEDGFKLADEDHHALNSTFTREMLHEYGYDVVASVDLSGVEIKSPRKKLVSEVVPHPDGGKTVNVTAVPVCVACEGKGKDSKGYPCKACSMTAATPPAEPPAEPAAKEVKAKPAGKPEPAPRPEPKAKPQKIDGAIVLFMPDEKRGKEQKAPTPKEVDSIIAGVGLKVGEDVEDAWKWKHYVCVGLFPYDKAFSAPQLDVLVEALTPAAKENRWIITKANDNHIRIA